MRKVIYSMGVSLDGFIAGPDIAVGGAGLACACMKLELIDEWRLFVSPLLLGGGRARVGQSLVGVPLAHLGGTGDKSRAGR